MLLETHIRTAQSCCHYLRPYFYRGYTNSTNLGAVVGKKVSVYTSDMHYFNLGAFGRWAGLLETPHSHRSTMLPVSSIRIRLLIQRL